MKQYIKKSALVAEIKDLYEDIDKCIGDLVLARSKHDKRGVFDAHWKMETLMVNTQQVLSYILPHLEVKEVQDTSLEKFKSLQHISRDLKSTVEDWAYAPNLYYFDGSWHVDWIHCDDGDSIKGFTAETPEEAIDKAYNWFHSTFCNG